MISLKSNPKAGKLPVPPPSHPELSAANDPGPIPDSLSRKKHPELNRPKRERPTQAQENNQAISEADAQMAEKHKPAGKLSALAAQIKDPERRAAVQKIEEEKAARRTTKRQVKKEVSKAKATGATSAMPLTGKEAEAALKAARKATASADGKAKVREAAKKAVSETKATKSSSIYDWDAATTKAKAGAVPPAPKFSSYGPHLQKCHDMAKAGQTKELREYLAGFNHEVINPGRKNLFRYGDLCLTAVKAAARAG